MRFSIRDTSASLLQSILLASVISRSLALPTGASPRTNTTVAAQAEVDAPSFWAPLASEFYIPGQSATEHSAAEEEEQFFNTATTTLKMRLTRPTIKINAASSRRLAAASASKKLAAAQAKATVCRVQNQSAAAARITSAWSASRRAASITSAAKATSRAKAASKSASLSKSKSLSAYSSAKRSSRSSVTSWRKSKTSSRLAAATSKSLASSRAAARITSLSRSQATATRRSTTAAPKPTTTKKAATTTKKASSPAVTVNFGLSNGKDYWKQKTFIYSVESFVSNVVNKMIWGLQNIEMVQGIPASKWAVGVTRDSETALQVAYPKGSRNPSSYPIGGVGFYSEKLDISAAETINLRYSVFFEKGFDFVKGGKLPGLYGGTTACSGGSTAENCFSARLMFRQNGQGEVYLYAPREKQVESTCTIGPLSYCNTFDGMSIGRGSWTFLTGQWNDIRQQIRLNTPGKADGGLDIWHNGKHVISANQVYYRNSAVGKVVNGTSSRNITLIDYENLPEGTVIPNGGFVTQPNIPGVFFPGGANTKIYIPGQPTARPDPNNAWNKKRNLVNFAAKATPAPNAAPRMFIRSDDAGQDSAQEDSDSADDENLTKRAVAAPIGFKGIMFNTFFGGSSAAWNSPKLQFSYFKGLRLDIDG